MTPDIIGAIYKPTGNTIVDSEGFEYPEMKAIDGFHVNFPTEVPEIAEYKVDPQPETPIRVYAGGLIPVSYKFSDQSEWETIKALHSDDEGALQFAPPPPRPPRTVTRRQFIQQLILEGIDETVEQSLNAIADEIQRKIMKAWFQESQVFEIYRPELNQMIHELGFTEKFRDEFFRRAAKL